MVNNQEPQSQSAFGEQHYDDTTDRIREVIATMGGAAMGEVAPPPRRSMAEWARDLPDGVIAGVLAGDPEAYRTATEAVARIAGRQLRRKTFFFQRYVDDESTPAGADANMLDNIIKIGSSDEAPGTERILRKAARHTFSTAQWDRFSIQDLGTEYATTLLNGAQDLDLADLAVALHASVVYDKELLEGKTPEEVDRASDRYNEFERAYLTELVAALKKRELYGEEFVSFTELYSKMFKVEPEQMLPSERRRVEAAQMLIQDRIAVGIVVDNAGFWVRGDKRGKSPYARPRSDGERDELDARAADTLEKLHLLRRYGVTPFEVPAEVTGLPYDIAVEPPLTMDADGNPAVAEGAVADFLFIPPGQERTGTGYVFTPTEDEWAQRVSVGGASIVMRLRLHDNGQISSGFQYHNIPSDHTQRAFAENGATLAFEQIRGLMIALAFDALVPDDIVNRRVGSVASTLRTPRQQSPGSGDSGIAELLLRRRRELNRAGIRPGHTTPADWEGPTMEVGGYVKRLPQGCRRRETANQEAIDYYRSVLGIDYPGLPDGYNFVRPYDRRVTREVTFRRARFRRDAATRRQLDSM